MPQKSSTYHRWLRRLAWALGVGSVVAVAWLGWQWQARVAVSAVVVEGATHADETKLADLARVDSGATLYDVDPDFVADRVQRHPWVETASVTRRPTGTLRIAVTERTPAGLALEDGTPAFYVDRDGFPMPLVEETVHDVPLIYGLDGDHHPTRPVEPSTLRALLHALDEEPEHDRIAEITVRSGGSLDVHTRPTDAQGAIRVRLGTEAYAERLRELDAFWEQAVQARPDVTFEQIDLRFDDQIVARHDE